MVESLSKGTMLNRRFGFQARQEDTQQSKLFPPRLGLRYSPYRLQDPRDTMQTILSLMGSISGQTMDANQHILYRGRASLVDPICSLHVDEFFTTYLCL